jgi:hypothetical protein
MDVDEAWFSMRPTGLLHMEGGSQVALKLTSGNVWEQDQPQARDLSLYGASLPSLRDVGTGFQNVRVRNLEMQGRKAVSYI